MSRFIQSICLSACALSLMAMSPLPPDEAPLPTAVLPVQPIQAISFPDLHLDASPPTPEVYNVLPT